MPKQKLTAAFVDKIVTDKQIDYYDENTSGLGLRVSPGGTKTFFYRYRFNGKNRRYSISRYSKKTFPLSAARIKVDELRSIVKKGGDPVGEEREWKRINRINASKEKSFSELAEEFKKVHLISLRKKTRDEHIRIIDNELIPALGNFPVKKVDKSEIIKFLDDKAIKSRKPTMANRIRARLHTIYEFGIHRGFVESNPVTGIKPYKKGENKRERFYSDEEITVLWKAFEQIGQPVGSLMKILLLTCQRKTETMKMQWDHLHGNVWTIPDSLAKGKRSHNVPLSDSAMKILMDLKKLSGNKTYVFSSKVLEDGPITDVKKSVEKVRELKINDLSVADFRLHDLRRTAATHMAKLKVNRTVLGKILNHKRLAGDGQVTAIYDRHDYLSEKKQALQKWANYVNNIVKKEA